MRGHGWRNAISWACRSVLSSTPSPPPPPSCSAPSSSSALLQQHRIQSRLMSNLLESTVYGGPISQTAVKRVTLRNLAKKYATGQPITVTAYDYPSAVHVDRAGIDIILVGESVAMVVHGHDTTLPIILEDRLLHCRAVGRGAQRSVLVEDLPFGSYEQSPQQAVDSATRILKEGCMDALKLEGAIGSISAKRAIVEAGIAVMGHEGLTPESMIDSPKPQIGQESHICGRDDGVLNTGENVQVNNSGSEELLGQEVHDESNTVNHVLGSNRGVAAILANPPGLKSKQRNSKRKLTGRALRSCSSSTWKLKPPGKKDPGGATLKPRHDARTVYALNRQINTLMESGYREEAYAVYRMILPAGCKPDSYTYLHLIKGLCEGGELAEARELFKWVLAEEEDNFCGRSEVILYNAMVHGLGSAGLVKEALDLVEEMRGRGFAPDMYTYNSILHSLGKLGMVTEALTIFESMADKGCSPDVVTYNSVILCLGKAGKAKEAYELYEVMRTEGCLPDHVTFNTLIPILGKIGELDLAINLYEFMTTSGCEPDVYTYTSLVTGFCRANRIDEALLLSLEMTKKGCAPNTVTFNSWLDGLCKGGRVVEAGLLFDKMLVLGYVPDKITYSILIDAFCKTGQFVDKSFELLKDLLKCSTCILDTRTSEIVYQSFKKVGMLKQANRIARNARAKQSRCVGSGLKLPVSTLKMVSETVREPH